MARELCSVQWLNFIEKIRKLQERELVPTLPVVKKMTGSCRHREKRAVPHYSCFAWKMTDGAENRAGV